MRERKRKYDPIINEPEKDEHQIGDIIEFLDGRIAEVVEDEEVTCTNCILYSEPCPGDCMSKFRHDHKNIYYKEIIKHK